MKKEKERYPHFFGAIFILRGIMRECSMCCRNYDGRVSLLKEALCRCKEYNVRNIIKGMLVESSVAIHWEMYPVFFLIFSNWFSHWKRFISELGILWIERVSGWLQVQLQQELTLFGLSPFSSTLFSFPCSDVVCCPVPFNNISSILPEKKNSCDIFVA